MKCYCEARLTSCDHRDKRCPASAFRLAFDTQQAMLDIYRFAARDEATTIRDRKCVDNDTGNG